MEQDWLELVACPVCLNELRFEDGAASFLVCQSCGDKYAIQDQVLVLAPAEELGILARFSLGYSRMRLKQGWRRVPADQALKLPFARPDGFPEIYWEVRQGSYTAIIDLLTKQGPAPAIGPVVELGAGNGWLSYNLTRSGYKVIALDCNLDENFGLGSARTYLHHADFTLVLGDLNRPPLLKNKFSLVIFNASLHYARDLAATLQRAREILLPQGRIVIMDSPVSELPYPGRAIGERRLGRQELADNLANVGLRAKWIPIERGARWYLEQLLRRARGKPQFTLPLIVAGKARS